MASSLIQTHELAQPVVTCVIDPYLLALGTPTNSARIPDAGPTSALIAATVTYVPKMPPALITTVDAATAFTSILDASPPLVPNPVTSLAAAQTPTLTVNPPPVGLNPFDLRCVLQNSNKDPLYLTAPQTHAQHHPDIGLQSQRQRAKLSDASKAVASLTAALNKTKAAHLNADIEKLLVAQEEQIKAIALDHGHKPGEITKIVYGTTNYSTEHSASIGNALVHQKGLELNKDRGVGERLSLCEIQRAIAEDPTYQNMSKADKDKAVKVLEAHRATQNISAHVTNKGAALDVYNTLNHIETEFKRLKIHPGADYYAMITNSSIDDLFDPTWMASPEAVAFLTDGARTNPWDLIRLFQQNVCSKAYESSGLEGLNTMRARVVKACQGGLTWVTNSQHATATVSMNYTNYEDSIMQGQKCKIVGYPPKVPFLSPSLITNLTKMHALHDGWMDGSIGWVQMTATEVKEHAADLEQHRMDGEIIGKKRKTRVAKRKVLEEGNSDEGDKENTQPRKKTKGQKKVRVLKKTGKNGVAAQMPPKSVSVIESSDEEDGGDNDPCGMAVTA